MTFNAIEYAVAAGVATITLNRPDRLNSFTEQMHAELREALAQVQADESVRCLLLTGNGRGFCAGQDLVDAQAVAGDAAIDLETIIEENYAPLVNTLAGLAMPVICAVNGVAAGAGANVAFAADIVLAARSASFIQAFCKIGLLPDAGGTWVLPRLVGRARAIGLSMLGDKISAEQAEAWGMIWRCVDDDDLMTEARNMAEQLATQPTKGLAYTKQAINASAANTLEEQLALEAKLQGLAGQTEDFKEGVDAFVEKRKPVFKGY